MLVHKQGPLVPTEQSLAPFFGMHELSQDFGKPETLVVPQAPPPFLARRGAPRSHNLLFPGVGG